MNKIDIILSNKTIIDIYKSLINSCKNDLEYHYNRFINHYKYNNIINDNDDIIKYFRYIILEDHKNINENELSYEMIKSKKAIVKFELDLNNI